MPQISRVEYYRMLLKAATSGVFPSMDQDGQCLYRLNSHKCAVGILIPDDVYLSYADNTGGLSGFNFFTRQDVIHVEGFIEQDYLIMQEIHDDFARQLLPFNEDQRKSFDVNGYIKALNECGVFTQEEIDQA